MRGKDKTDLAFSQRKVCFHYIFAIDVTISGCEELINRSPPLGEGPDTCLRETGL